MTEQRRSFLNSVRYNLSTKRALDEIERSREAQERALSEANALAERINYSLARAEAMRERRKR